MSKNIIDSRDLVERLEELRGLKEALEDARNERAEIESSPSSTQEEIDKANDAVEDAIDQFGEWEQNELNELETLENEVSEWSSGNPLVHEDYWGQYAQQLVEDVGDLPRDLPSYIVIDWSATADNLRADYSEVTYLGNTYLVRDY